jgi:hypothetical protein
MSADAIRKKTEKRTRKWREMRKKGGKGKRKKTMKYNRGNINRPERKETTTYSKRRVKAVFRIRIRLDPHSICVLVPGPGSVFGIRIRIPD